MKFDLSVDFEGTVTLGDELDEGSPLITFQFHNALAVLSNAQRIKLIEEVLKNAYAFDHKTEIFE